MSWLRLDDRFDSNPKLIELSELERWRWVRVLLYCSRGETDGVVTRAALREMRLPVPRLVELGLLDELEDGRLIVHDFLEFNPSRDDRERERERWKVRKRRSRGSDVTGGVTGGPSVESQPLRAGPVPFPNYHQPLVGSTSVAREERDGHPLDRLLDALELDPARMDYAYGLGARVAPEVVAGILEGLELHSNDPAGYALEALRQAAT